MADFPKTIRMVRGGKRRLVIFTQPYFPRCCDVLRAAFMETVA